MNSLVVIMFIAVICIGIALLVIISLTRRGGSLLDQEKYRSQWLAITQSVTQDEGSKQFAVISADKLLDQAMREVGVTGESMGERLKNAKSRFRNNDSVWRAHKLRNRIAHEGNITISNQQTQGALGSFKQALTDLGAL